MFVHVKTLLAMSVGFLHLGVASMTHPSVIVITMKHITKPTHGSLEWLQTRHKHDGQTIVGASEVSIIMGCNDYKNIIDLAIEKMQPPVVREQNDAMKRGTWLESGLITAAQEELNLQVETPEVMYLNGRIIATLDGLANDGRLIECKTTTKWVANDLCLPEWYWQAQAQMFCADAELVTFVVLDRQLRISMFDVVRHNNDIELMVERVTAFCESIDADKLPEDVPLNHAQVSLLHPQPSGELEIDHTGLSLIMEWNAAKAALKELEQLEARLKDQLANMMREHDTATIDGQKVLTFKAQSTSRFDSKAFNDAHPDMAKQFSKTTSFRVMRTVKGAV